MSKQPYNKEAFGGSAPENYERHFVPAIGSPLAKELVEIADIRSGERVLDVASGTGIVARLAAERVGPSGTVDGLDINPGMLAVARTATPPGVDINWHEANVERMPFPDKSFDVVMSQMGLQFVGDRSAALREMLRVLVSGGRLILNLPGPTPALMEVMGKLLARYIGAEAEGFLKHVFLLHDKEEIQKLIEDAGFHDVNVKADTKSLRLPPPKEFFWGYVHSTPISGMVAKVDKEQIALLDRDILTDFQEFVKDGSLVIQVRIVVAKAWKQ